MGLLLFFLWHFLYFHMSHLKKKISFWEKGMKRILIFQPIFQKYLRMDIQKLWYNIKQILIHFTIHIFLQKKDIKWMSKIFFFWKKGGKKWKKNYYVRFYSVYGIILFYFLLCFAHFGLSHDQHNIGHWKDLAQLTKAQKPGSFRKLIPFQECITAWISLH